jgi:hypothetical protein
MIKIVIIKFKEIFLFFSFSLPLVFNVTRTNTENYKTSLG